MNKIEKNIIISNETNTPINNEQESFMSMIFRFIIDILKIAKEVGRNIKP